MAWAPEKPAKPPAMLCSLRSRSGSGFPPTPLSKVQLSSFSATPQLSPSSVLDTRQKALIKANRLNSSTVSNAVLEVSKKLSDPEYLISEEAICHQNSIYVHYTVTLNFEVNIDEAAMLSGIFLKAGWTGFAVEQYLTSKGEIHSTLCFFPHYRPHKYFNRPAESMWNSIVDQELNSGLNPR